MTNIFGGGNKNSLYVPMSEDEQEVLERIQSDHNLVVKLKGWGEIRPIVQFGDSRVALYLDIHFTAPETPVPVRFFDLELWNGGDLLYKDRQSLHLSGQSTMIGAGIDLSMIWDISIHHMDPAWVKKMKPGAHGVTSRVLDPVTGKPTLRGNMVLSEDHMRILHQMRLAEQQTRVKVGNRISEIAKISSDDQIDPNTIAQIKSAPAIKG